jgi:putative N6-adenine-specific DNA methylase
VARELTALGESPRIDEGGGGVTWEGDSRSIMRANLWLRSASRVVVRVATFEATAFYELERRAKKIPWDQFIAGGRGAEFKVTARKSRLYHSDAIAERMMKAVGSRAKGASRDGVPSTTRQSEAEAQLFLVRVVHDEFTVSADTSGDLLHMRGYRQEAGKAPLRETLAAALLLATEWRGDEPLLDPFCGSGTIPIEAALIARRLPPGLRRRFAFMQWPDFDERTWRKLTREAETHALTKAPAPILGSDRDAGAVAASRANAERAGTATDVDFSERALSAIEPPAGPGLVATNPPYGVRVGDSGELRNLYAQLGHVLRQRCARWRVAMFSPEDRLAKQTGLKLREVLRSTNGGIKVSALTGTVSSGADAGLDSGPANPKQ